MCSIQLAKSKTRLDVAVVERELAASRERARALILAGQVKVNGAVVSKAGAPVAADAVVELVTPDHPYVGRGGVKLAHALDHRNVQARFAFSQSDRTQRTPTSQERI